MRPRDLNLGQRVIAIVSLAAVFRVVGAYIVGQNTWKGGWFNYAPLSSEVPSVSSGWLFGAALLWVLLIVIWTAVSIWLLGLPYRRSGPLSETEDSP